MVKVIARITLFLLVAHSSSTFAQIALPSIFPGVKNENPALFGKRKMGAVILDFAKDHIDKKQTIPSQDAYPSGAEIEDEKSLETTRLFYGGKGGDFWTIEADLTIHNSDRSYIFEDYRDGTEAFHGRKFEDGIIRSSYISYGVGLFEYLGYSYGSVDHVEQGLLFTYHNPNGILDRYTNENFQDLVAVSYENRYGLAFQMGSIHVGGFFRNYHTRFRDMFETANALISWDSEEFSNDSYSIGIGLEHSFGQFEVGFEAEIDQPGNRMILVAEFDLFGLLLGYTGLLNSNGYRSPETTVTDIASRKSGEVEATSLTHRIRFSLGESHGLSFGGSLFALNSKVEEETALAPEAGKVKTIIKELGWGVNVGYVF